MLAPTAIAWRGPKAMTTEPTPAAEDEEVVLIRRARDGDREAFGVLVQRYQNAVYNLCYRMLGDFHEAEDATQEVFLKIYRRLEKYNPAYRFSTWVLSVASHHCIDRLRRRRVTWVSLDTPELTPAHAPAPPPEEEVLRRETADQVQRMLDHLPPDYRAVLVLRYWYDLSHKEIGQILNASEGAIKTKVHRARRRLGTLLVKEGWTP